MGLRMAGVAPGELSIESGQRYTVAARRVATAGRRSSGVARWRPDYCSWLNFAAAAAAATCCFSNTMSLTHIQLLLCCCQCQDAWTVLPQFVVSMFTNSTWDSAIPPTVSTGCHLLINSSPWMILAIRLAIDGITERYPKCWEGMIYHFEKSFHRKY